MTPEQVEKFKLVVEKYNSKDPSLSDLERKVVEKVVASHQKVAELNALLQDLQNKAQELNLKLAEATQQMVKERAVADSFINLLLEGK